MDEVYLVYCAAEQFHSRLAYSRFDAFSTLAILIFGKRPDPDSDPELFDEFVAIKNDFDNANLWSEGGNVWEVELGTGFATVVRVQSLIN